MTPANTTIDRPTAGQLWAAGDDARVLLLVVRQVGDRLLVAPVTFDALSADDETVVVSANQSPFGMPLAVYPMLTVELPASLLTTLFGQLVPTADIDRLLAGSLPDTIRGESIDGPTDPRLEFRQMLIDRLGALEDVEPDPNTGAEAPPPRPERVASALAADLRDRRGEACKIHRLGSWEDLILAYSRGWAPIAAVDEFGIVLIVFDTTSGLTNDADFNAAMSVLTQFNASALVVLATSLSHAADVFDAASLNYGIGVPSGETAPPSPVLAGLAPADAVSKFLDQNSAWSEAAWSMRGATSPSDVIATLSQAAASAIEEVVRQGRRARIGPKVAGYTSVENLVHDLDKVLRGALAGEPVTERLSDLADWREQ